MLYILCYVMFVCRLFDTMKPFHYVVGPEYWENRGETKFAVYSIHFVSLVEMMFGISSTLAQEFICE